MIISLYILTILWIISIFTFAKLRISLTGKKAPFTGAHKDWICLAYMRITGILILFVIFSLVKMN